MKRKLSSSLIRAARCQHRTPTGRQCCCLVADARAGLCSRHAAMQQSHAADFAAPLLSDAARFQNAQGINHSLRALYALLAQDRISPRRASVLAYISSLLLRTLPAIDNDPYPHAGLAPVPEIVPDLSSQDDEANEDPETDGDPEAPEDLPQPTRDTVPAMDADLIGMPIDPRKKPS